MTNNNNRSPFSGFYKLDQDDRLNRLLDNTPVDSIDVQLLKKESSLQFELSNLFVENSLGHFPLPMGLVTNVLLNGKDYVVPFAVEESSVIAASSNASKWIKNSGGFQAQTIRSVMIGQIQILEVSPEDMPSVAEKILNEKDRLIALANEIHPRLLQRGGGTRDLEVRSFPDAEIPFMVVHVLIDTQEAMGANLINTVCEKVAPEIEKLCEARIGLRILSNYATEQRYRVTCRVNPAEFAEKGKNNGHEVAQKIYEAYVFAKHDPYRASTHNKGILNGIDPVVIATGNDWRANEAGIHAYASKDGHYSSLSRWSIDDDGCLLGELELPMQLGTVGGITRLHPIAQLALKIMDNPSSHELAQIALATGLASNLAALRALVTTGIQAGHMKLHAKNLALAAGAKGPEIEKVAANMVKSGNISQKEAEKVIKQMRTAANGKFSENSSHLPTN